MAQTEYEIEREELANYLRAFLRLERDEPEVAKRLGFAGYVQFQDTRFYMNERFHQLERMASDLASLLNK